MPPARALLALRAHRARKSGLGLSVTVAIALLAASAAAHSWYDPACCSDEDCFGPEKGVTGEVIPGGYVIRWQGKAWLVAEKDTRNSQDGFYHICLPKWAEKPICVYRPLAGT